MRYMSWKIVTLLFSKEWKIGVNCKEYERRKKYYAILENDVTWTRFMIEHACQEWGILIKKNVFIRFFFLYYRLYRKTMLILKSYKGIYCTWLIWSIYLRMPRYCSYILNQLQVFELQLLCVPFKGEMADLK